MTALTDNDILDIQLRNRGNKDVEKLVEEVTAQGAALIQIAAKFERLNYLESSRTDLRNTLKDIEAIVETVS